MSSDFIRGPLSQPCAPTWNFCSWLVVVVGRFDDRSRHRNHGTSCHALDVGEIFIFSHSKVFVGRPPINDVGINIRILRSGPVRKQLTEHDLEGVQVQPFRVAIDDELSECDLNVEKVCVLRHVRPPLLQSLLYDIVERLDGVRVCPVFGDERLLVVHLLVIDVGKCLTHGFQRPSPAIRRNLCDFGAHCGLQQLDDVQIVAAWYVLKVNVQNLTRLVEQNGTPHPNCAPDADSMAAVLLPHSKRRLVDLHLLRKGQHLYQKFLVGRYGQLAEKDLPLRDALCADVELVVRELSTQARTSGI